MAKIISLHQKENFKDAFPQIDGDNKIRSWISEMNTLLLSIEDSLKNTSNNAAKDLNSRR